MQSLESYLPYTMSKRQREAFEDEAWNCIYEKYVTEAERKDDKTLNDAK
jgi:hypothetical protein